MRADPEALCGLITVQLGLAAPRDVLAARRATPEARSAGLARTLEELGTLSAADRALVETISRELLATSDGDPGRALERFGGEAALMSTFGAAFDAPPRQTLPADADTDADAEQASANDDAFSVTLEHPGRYTLGGRRGGDVPVEDAELGRGGIGRVLVAFDEHIGREVAVKELLPEALTRSRVTADGRMSTAVVRFLREARVTGQLEHPNIVPVYELGRRRDGSLYYTMKVVRGRTMADALDDAEGLGERLGLLKHFADVCDAIAYAHSRGVIHRDIKPDNVMLGEFGETVVLDWGLAKARGESDVEPVPSDGSDEPGAHALSDAQQEATVDGQLVGTPLYMSPEQATGENARIDSRSDVWSLGATLYELLTGRPPFVAGDVLSLLLEVAQGKLVPAREREPDAPAELAAIAAKALSRDPADRYPDARAMAEEIRSYLTGGRVRAYHYGSLELLKRWASRHKAALVVAAAAVVALVALGVVSYLEVVAERDKAVQAEAAAQKARAAAVAARQDAERARDGAEQLVQFMLDDLRTKLEPVGRLEILDEVVTAVERYYAGQDVGGDPRRAAGRAAAHALVGDVLRARGELDDADAAYAAAIDGARGNTSPAAALARAEAHLGRARVRESRGDLAAATTQLDAAAQALERVPQDAPQALDAALRRGSVLLFRGDVLGALDRRTEQLASYTSALEAMKSLAERRPDESRPRELLALAYDRAGNVALDVGEADLARAQRLYEQAETIRLELLDADPEHAAVLRELAASHDALGDIALRRQDLKAAEDRYSRSLAVMRRLTRRDPGNTRWQRDLAVSQTRVGDVRTRRGDAEGALKAYAEARKTFETLSSLDPANTDWRRDVEVAHNREGDALLEAERAGEALRSFEAALAIASALHEARPERADWRGDLATTRLRVARAQAALGRKDDAKATLEAAEALLKPLAAQEDGDPAWKADLQALAELRKALAGRARPPRRRSNPPQRIRKEGRKTRGDNPDPMQRLRKKRGGGETLKVPPF